MADLDGYEKMILGSTNRTAEEIITWNQKQVYIALGFLMHACADKGIDSCPMEGFSAAEFDKILGLTDYTATVLCPVGYRAASDKYATQPKMRFDAKDVIEHR